MQSIMGKKKKPASKGSEARGASRHVSSVRGESSSPLLPSGGTSRVSTRVGDQHRIDISLSAAKPHFLTTQRLEEPSISFNKLLFCLNYY